MISNPDIEYKSIADSAPLMMIQINPDGVINYINHLQPGYKMEDVVGSKVYDYVAPEHHELYTTNIKKVISSGETSNFTIKVNLIDYSAWYEVHIAPVKNDDEVRNIVIASLDVTEKKNAQDKLENALKEKEILLKEVHHRAKNNLQILSSIMNLHKDKTNDNKIIDTLDECKNSIHSLALAHECLYKSNDFSKVDFANYIERFCSYFNLSINTNSKIDLVLKLEQVFISLDKAITTGLILNEMMTNSYKHGFPGDAKGTITINLEKQDPLIKLVVSDNGVGLDKPQTEIDSDSLGMELIRVMVDQLDGEITSSSSPQGLSYAITFEG